MILKNQYLSTKTENLSLLCIYKPHFFSFSLFETEQSHMLRNVSPELCSSGSDLHLKCPCLTLPKIHMNLKLSVSGHAIF